jgi:general secretion pathway protein L
MSLAEKIKRFYSWWLATLGELLTRRKPAAQTWHTLLQNAPQELEIYVRSGSSAEAIGTLTADASDEQAAILKSMLEKDSRANLKQVLLRLSPSDVLQHTLQIPDAASDLVAPIIENQLERLVPWPAADTRYGYRVIGASQEAPSQIDVEIVATRKDILDSALVRARRLGLEPFAADYALSRDARSSIELMSLRADPARKAAATLHTLLLSALVCAFLAAAAGAYHLWQQQEALSSLDAESLAARDRVAALGRLAAENDQLRAQRDQLMRRKQDEPPIVLLMEALSRALPDSSFATEIEFEKRDVRVVGKSANATALITDLEDSPHFADVRFAAPTTREATETLESFVIIGRTEGGAELEAKP